MQLNESINDIFAGVSIFKVSKNQLTDLEFQKLIGNESCVILVKGNDNNEKLESFYKKVAKGAFYR